MKLVYRGLSYDRQPASNQAPSAISNAQMVAAKAPSQMLFYRGVEYRTNPAQSNAVPAVALQHPIELIYRGVHYTIGGTQTVASVQPTVAVQSAPVQLEPITELARELLIALRQKANRREQSVLKRFQADIGLADDGWTVYRHHDAAMS
jgi:hypothetical protein